MKKNNSIPNQLAVKIDRFINKILRGCFFLLLVVISQNILGGSKDAFIASIIIGSVFSFIIIKIIERSVIDFGFLRLIIALLFVLAFAFLLM